MFKYVKSLQYPINIKKKNLKMARCILTQYGGANYKRDFRKDEVMNSYCIYLKKRKNKPFCKFKNKEIPFSCCQECDNKEYKKDPANINIKRKNEKIRSIKSIERKNVKIRSKSKKLAKIEKNRFSVFSDNANKCFLCGSIYNLTWHEIYSGRNRQNSMKYGLCLRLCINCHSREQENSQFNDYWHRQGQLYWEKNIGSREEFINVFKKNYL